MQKSFFELLSLGNRFWFASFLYIGLSLVLFGIAPDMATVHAGAGIECPEGATSVLVGETYECQCAE